MVSDISNELLIQWGFNSALSTDRQPCTLTLHVAFSSLNYWFIRVPNSISKDLYLQCAFGGTKISSTQVQFWTSNTSYYLGDNWLAVGC